MADENPRFRIALIGDSHAFSFEVPFEDSWGYHLQRLLGDGTQVLNFGVDGYGIDQAYLRYQRDVRPWKPKVVVIGFAGHDLWRALAVYPFVSFRWPGYLVKPRFAIEKEGLKLLNAPLPTPAEILGAGVLALQVLGRDRDGDEQQPDERARDGGAAAEEVMEAERDHRPKVPGGTGPSVRPPTASSSDGIGSEDRPVAGMAPILPKDQCLQDHRGGPLNPCLQRRWPRPADLRLHRPGALLVAP